MTFAEFHNGLRVLLNIDQDEFTQAIWPEHDGTRPARDSEMGRAWQAFRCDPHMWFIRAPTERAQAIWKIVEQRTARYPNGAPMYAGDGMMLDENGNRSVFDDVDQ